MTLNATSNKKGSSSSDAAVAAREAEGSGEAVPSYEEAVGAVPTSSSSSANAAGASVVDAHRPAPPTDRQLYPFPSMGTFNSGYGQSPYQADGTQRIPIQVAPPVAGPQDGLLPLPVNVQRRGPRAGRRFCAAFFWAVILYIILGIVLGFVYDIDSDAGHGHPPRPPTGGPPGWHHHHPGQGGGKHGGRLGLLPKKIGHVFVKRSSDVVSS